MSCLHLSFYQGKNLLRSSYLTLVHSSHVYTSNISLFQSYLHLTFHSCLSRVSLRLGYRSRPIRICNDMSLSFITFLSIFKYVFNISVLKWARFGIIDRCLDCYLHQRLVCLVVKLSFVSLGLLTLLTFKVCLFHLFGFQQDIRLSH